MQAIISLSCCIVSLLNKIGEFLPQLGLRFLLAYEFWEAGVVKFKGSNWFMNIQDDFPFPFNIVPTDISWFIATWTELLGSIALVVGFATRFSAAALIILDLVAWYSVHAANGYNVGGNGYKLQLIYLLMFLPLLFSGPGKASIDYLISCNYCSDETK